MTRKYLITLIILFVARIGSGQPEAARNRPLKVFLCGDSTVADYTQDSDCITAGYPVTGWGQVFQPFMSRDSLKKTPILIKTDTVIMDNRAKGGYSPRIFFQEGRWRAVHDELQPGDLVLMQFGHNDGAVDKPERYVNLQRYKEFLRLFVSQTREKGGIPILLTPVIQNYPWKNGVLKNVHGEYLHAVREIADEMNVYLIDLNLISCDFFTKLGKEFVTKHYFMNFPGSLYPTYPNGQNDNTHFQLEGAKAVYQLVFNAMKDLKPLK